MSQVRIQNTGLREGVQGETPERTVVIDIGPRKITREVGGKRIEIAAYHFPIYPYANYVKYVLELDIEKKELRYYVVKMNWGGTGKDDRGHVHLSDEELEKIKGKMLSIKTLDDFNDLVDLFEEMQRERERKIEETLDRVVEAIEDLISRDETLRNLEWLLEDKNELKEKLREWASL